jgi:hypothetical protein
MIGARLLISFAMTGLLAGTAPIAALAQVTGKETVPGGVELRPPMPAAPQSMPMPSAPAITPARPAPAIAPPAAGPAGAPSAAPVAPPADKAAPVEQGGKKKKSSKRYYYGTQPDGAARPSESSRKTIPPSIGGSGDERRPGGVERAPAQPQ